MSKRLAHRPTKYDPETTPQEVREFATIAALAESYLKICDTVGRGLGAA